MTASQAVDVPKAVTAEQAVLSTLLALGEAVSVQLEGVLVGAV